MTKISKSFRLSEQAQNYLHQLVLQTGSSETAIVELSIANFAKMMQRNTSLEQQPEPESPPEFYQDGRGNNVRGSLPPTKSQNSGQGNYKKKR